MLSVNIQQVQDQKCTMMHTNTQNLGITETGHWMFGNGLQS